MSVYIHVPFCASHCIYCDFYVVLEKHGRAQYGAQYQQVYVDAVCQEIELRLKPPVQSDIQSNLPSNLNSAFKSAATSLEPIQTIYVGGGTPSLIPAEAYGQIFETLKRYWPFSPDVEITLEANPGLSHFSPNKIPFTQDHEQVNMLAQLSAYLDVGFNRVSVGVQSLNDIELKKLSRAHTATEAINFIECLKQVGWRNISIDLMYGIPLQTRESWQETLKQAMALGIQHISMYGLKVEDHTPLALLTALKSIPPTLALPRKGGGDIISSKEGHQFQEGNQFEWGINNSSLNMKSPPPFAGEGRVGGGNLPQPQPLEVKNPYALPDEDEMATLYEMAVQQLGSLGFKRYEFSNLALDGAVSRHNLNYWNNGEYLALGVAAHGYWQGQRYETVRDLKMYLDNPCAGESRPCSSIEQLENALIFGLRKLEGVHIAELETRYEIDFRQQYAKVLQRWEGEFLEWDGPFLRLTERAISVSNAILLEFLHD